MMRRSRSVFDPEMHPLCADFEDAGMQRRVGAGCSVGCASAPTRPRCRSGCCSLDFLQAVAACASGGRRPCSWPQPLRPPGAPLRRDEQNAKPSRVQAGCTSAAGRGGGAPELWRAARGAGEERRAVRRGGEQVPEPSVDKRRAHALYYDSYCAAVWTSAHAEYLATVHPDLLGSRVGHRGSWCATSWCRPRAVQRDQPEQPAAHWRRSTSAPPRRAAAPSRRRRSWPS